MNKNMNKHVNYKKNKKRAALFTAVFMMLQSTLGIFAGMGITPASVAYAAFDRDIGDPRLPVEGKRYTPTKEQPYTYKDGAHVYIMHLEEGDVLGNGVVIHNFEGNNKWDIKDKSKTMAQNCEVYFDEKDRKPSYTISKNRPYTPYTTESSVKVTKIERKNKVANARYTDVKLYLESYTPPQYIHEDKYVYVRDLEVGDVIEEATILKTDGLDENAILYGGLKLRYIVGSRGELYVPYNDGVVVDKQVDPNNPDKITINIERAWDAGKAGTTGTLKLSLQKDEKTTLEDNIYLEDSIVIDDGRTHTIDLNGFRLTGIMMGKGILSIKNSSKLIIEDSSKGAGTIEDGYAELGGGICVEDSSTLIMKGGVITDCYAREGGGIYIGNGCKAELSDVEINDNDASTRFAKTSGSIQGGGIRVADGASCKINNCIIKYNWSIEGSGAGISNSGTIDIEDSEIVNSHVRGGNGAGIYSDGEVYMKNTEVSNGYGADNGGGIYNCGNMTIEDCNISGNNAVKAGGGFYIDYGDGEGKTVFSGENSILYNRSEEYGGGMYIASSGDKKTSNVLKKLTFSYNYAFKDGGAFYIGTGAKETTLTDIIMDNNVSDEYGGAIFAKSPITLSGCQIRLNTASKKGGGIYTDFDGNKYNLTIESSSIQENNSYEKGGGIWMEDQAKAPKLVLAGGKTHIYMNNVLPKDSKTAVPTENNLVFNKFREILVTGTLAKGSEIGITCMDSFSGERTITRDYGEYNDEPIDSYFVYNGSDHKVKPDDELTEVVLMKKLTPSAEGYNIKVSVKVTDDADDWADAHIDVYCKKDNGLGEEVLHYTSENIASSIDHSGGEYKTGVIDCGNAFPSKVNVYTNFGGGGVKRDFEADVDVLINDVNCGSKHIEISLWGNTKDKGKADNWITIGGDKYPYPEDFEVIKKREIDLIDDKSKVVTVEGIDQYGVNWEANGKDNFKIENISFPGEDTFESLDDMGLKWKFDTSKTDECHNSIYKVSYKSGSNYKKWNSINIGVRFKVPLYVDIQVGNETDGYKKVDKVAGHQNDTISINTPKLNKGYKVAKVTKSGACILMDTEEDKYDFTFMTQNVKLVFETEPIKYYIKFDKNASKSMKVSGSISKMTVNYNKDVVLTKNSFQSKAGGIFDCWNTKPDGSGTSYKDSEVVKNLTDVHRETITLYAQWKDKDGNKMTASLFSEGTLIIWFGCGAFLVAIVLCGYYSMAKKKKGARKM